MPISFSCHQCGRNLKAPESAAGKSTKCPGCAATVTCPDAVYDAELLEAPSLGADGYGVADRELDGAYAMSGPPVGAAVAPDARRPCPMCGEMIIATAAKCRFCGEVFDATLKKAGLGGKQAKSIAAAQKSMVGCAGLLLLAWLGSVAITAAIGPNIEPIWIVIRLVIGVTALVGYVGIAACIFMLGRRMYSTGTAILLTLLAIIPCANLVIAFIVNQRVNRYLEDNGYSIGLFGAKVP